MGPPSCRPWGEGAVPRAGGFHTAMTLTETAVPPGLRPQEACSALLCFSSRAGSPLATGYGLFHRLGPGRPACTPRGSPVPEAPPPHNKPIMWGRGAGPGASFPVGEGQLDSRGPWGSDHPWARTAPKQPALQPHPTCISGRGSPAAVTGQAAARPAVCSCSVVSAGDVCSSGPRMNKRLETVCGH